MVRRTLGLGVLVMLVGATLLLVGWTLVSPGATPLTSTGLSTPATSPVPSETAAPSNTTVGIFGLPVGSLLSGNFTVLAGGEGPAEPVSFFVLNTSEWQAYNASYGALTSRAPSSYELSFAGTTGRSWQGLTYGPGPCALVYVSGSGSGGSLIEHVAFTPPGASENQTDRALPSEVALPPESPTPGRQLLAVPALSSLALGVGGTFTIDGGANGSATLYALSPNGTAACPASSFLPTSLACDGSFVGGPSLRAGEAPTSWFFHVHGVATGWVVVALSLLDRPTSLRTNLTQWDLPPGVVLGARTLLEASGATIGFFGVLAFSGAVVARHRIDEDQLPAVQSAALPGGATMPAVVSSDPSSLGASIPPSSTPAATSVGIPPTVPLLAGEVPVLEMATALPPSDGARPPSSSDGASRVTCGLCGTGYFPRGKTPGCPVCGSKTVVFTPATGVELL